MDFTNDIVKIKDLVDRAHEILIVTHERPTFDSMGSALALSLGLTSLGKKVTVACPDPVTVELSGFVGVNKVVSALGKKNFIISLDYVDGSIEKVSYNIEGDKFNLVIEPRPGFENFSEDKVHYTYAGSAANLIFTVDTIHLGGLKKLYEDDKELYASKSIVNVDRHPNNAHYGHTNMVNPGASSTAEVVAQLLGGLGVSLTEDIATNLLNALFGATDNFQNGNVTATAFELAGACMKAGGKKFGSAPTPQEEVPGVGGESVAREPRRVETVPFGSASFDKTQDKQGKPVSAPASASVGNQPAPASSVQPAGVSAVAPVNNQPAGTSSASEQKTKGQASSAGSGQAPPDWLKPKIFKSSNLG